MLCVSTHYGNTAMDAKSKQTPDCPDNPQLSSIETLLYELHTCSDGLAEAVVEQRFKQFGRNELQAKETGSALV